MMAPIATGKKMTPNMPRQPRGSRATSPQTRLAIASGCAGFPETGFMCAGNFGGAVESEVIENHSGWTVPQVCQLGRLVFQTRV